MGVSSSSLLRTTLGGLAQLARAPALQAGGHRFESDILHISKLKSLLPIFDILRKVISSKAKRSNCKVAAFHTLNRKNEYLQRRVLQETRLDSTRYKRSRKGQQADALALEGEEGRDKLRKVLGRCK